MFIASLLMETFDPIGIADSLSFILLRNIRFINKSVLKLS